MTNNTEALRKQYIMLDNPTIQVKGTPPQTNVKPGSLSKRLVYHLALNRKRGLRLSHIIMKEWAFYTETGGFLSMALDCGDKALLSFVSNRMFIKYKRRRRITTLPTINTLQCWHIWLLLLMHKHSQRPRMVKNMTIDEYKSRR